MRELRVLFLSGLIASTAFSMDSDVLEEAVSDRSSRVSVPDMNSDWDGDVEDEGEGAGTKRKSPDRKKRRVKTSPRRAVPSSDSEDEDETYAAKENEKPADFKGMFRRPNVWLLPDPSPSVSRGSPSARVTDDDSNDSDYYPSDSSYHESGDERKAHEDRSVYPEPKTPDKAVFTLRSFITEDDPHVIERARTYFEIVFASDPDIREANYSLKMLIKDLTGKDTAFRLVYFKEKINEWPDIIATVK